MSSFTLEGIIASASIKVSDDAGDPSLEETMVQGLHTLVETKNLCLGICLNSPESRFNYKDVVPDQWEIH